MTWIHIIAIWLAVACIVGPIIGRCIRGPRNGGQK